MRLHKTVNIVLIIIALSLNCVQAKNPRKISGEMISVSSGYYIPLFKVGNEPTKQFIKQFYIQPHLVTNIEYLEFVKANPEWRKSKVKRIFADANYLRMWKSDIDLGPQVKPNEPVTDISWFAANAYCKWIGMRLPTVSEWEFAAKRNNKIFFQERINEWTMDFNETNIMASSVCGGAGAIANTPEDYAAFLRYSYRDNLKANYSLDDLGFRCVSDSPEKYSQQLNVLVVKK